MKRVLYIIPYLNLFPPKNGGALRNYYLSYELSKYNDLTLLVLQDENEFIDGHEEYNWNKEIKFVKTHRRKESNNLINRLFYSFLSRIYQQKILSSANSFILSAYPPLKKLFLSQTFDVIIFAHLESLSLLPLVKRMNPLAKYLLDAHNVDHLLFAEQNDLGLKKIKNEFNQLKKIESQLSNIVHGIITCSAIDFNIFHHLNSSSLKGIVVPNGVDINRNTFQVFKDNNTPRLLFCGSLDYGPNKEGIIWFANEVWPLVLKQFKNATLTIIGRNPSRDTISFFSGIQGINFIGPVKDVRLFYKECTISIVPIFTGSGTRLKILEAMALGIPVVSTSKGAEGIDIEDGKNIVIADNKTVMYKSICYLLFNSTFYYTIRKEARLLVEENYSWTKNGILLNNYINEIHIK